MGKVARGRSWNHQHEPPQRSDDQFRDEIGKFGQGLRQIDQQVNQLSGPQIAFSRASRSRRATALRRSEFIENRRALRTTGLCIPQRWAARDPNSLIKDRSIADHVAPLTSS